MKPQAKKKCRHVIIPLITISLLLSSTGLLALQLVKPANKALADVTQLNIGQVSAIAQSVGNLNIAGYATASASLAVGYQEVPAGVGNFVASGNVGIGTTNPGYKLDVSGNINFTGKLNEDGNEILSGMVAVFASACPAGWTEYTNARGREVIGNCNGCTVTTAQGTAFTSNAQTRTITSVPAHTHSVDPPSTATDTTGAHVHDVIMNITDATLQDNTGSLDAGYNSGRFSKGGMIYSSGDHAHTVDIAQFNSGSTGLASVDVTMPYIQLTYCSKNAGSDLAEWTKSKEKYEPGTVVSADPDATEQIKVSEKAYDPTVLGIISTDPGWIIGKENQPSLMLALSGRVPVKVAPTSSPIKIGDALTTSGEPGKVMKAEKAGPIVAKALEDWDKESGKKQIVVFVNNSWYDPDVYLTNAGDLKIVGQPDGSFALKNKDSLIVRIGSFAELVVAKIQVGLIEAKKIVIDGTDIVKKLNELNDKVVEQQKEIDELQKQIEELKKR